MPASEADLSESELEDTKQRGKKKQAGNRSRAVDKKKTQVPSTPHGNLLFRLGISVLLLTLVCTGCRHLQIYEEEEA